MPIEHKNDIGKLLEFHLSGKLTKSDYETFVPLVESVVKEHGKIRLLVIMHDFHGWNAGALWEDIKFDAKHFADIERLAIVGETKWQEWMSKFCRPFTTAKIKYFDANEVESARTWIAKQQVHQKA
ncbi:MAG: STAS/SEC14 domain-containing protein [Phycisphaerales bacterium]|nr:STAS/SEC14 domain-containing protein [Phycisphaerales bacterium]MCB9856982.1 STAS/SEC14 domain-containing protein [Phycisphaerales bacterium]MCB9861891.1 STAS/SEC14 domain-containing protein [Phycisphaerales bacterium]